ncbi:MAG: hypothetical protein QOJ13_1065 [Gaiellales bacterium]|jgi:hypothetical protein|nr:hypothetical protein [Gaiellales bacterium]
MAVTSYVITTNVDERFTNFGAAGALLYAGLTYVVLVFVCLRDVGEAPAG